MSDNVRAHQERESIMTKTSRFNYIKRGLVGVCAATMLTGLCAGAAFGDVNVTGGLDVTGTSDTSVVVDKANLTGAQISATVPSSAPVSFSVAGGALTGPNTVDFAIKDSGSTAGLKITGIAVTDTSSLLESYNESANPTSGKMMMQIGTKTAVDSALANIVDLSASSSASLGQWKIAKGSSLILGVNGKITPNDGMLTKIGANTLDLFTIEWTIGLDL